MANFTESRDPKGNLNYLVGENYSTAISNEQKLTDDLIESLSKQILNKINTKLNDL